MTDHQTLSGQNLHDRRSSGQEGGVSLPHTLSLTFEDEQTVSEALRCVNLGRQPELWSQDESLEDGDGLCPSLHSMHLSSRQKTRDCQADCWNTKPDSQEKAYVREDILDDTLWQQHLLCEEFQTKQSSRKYQRMQEFREKLPIWKMKDYILSTIARSQVVVISGDTGCGKTTQVPQFLLDDAILQKNGRAQIVCTQPRRIAAITVAQRVAEERDEVVGRFVGYQIRFESVMSPYTRLLYCTTGIVLRRLENDPDLQHLQGLSHIIVDEVHERTAESDFLLMNLRLLLEERPSLRVVLMSATMNAELFSNFFGGCPVLYIPGKIFAVRQFFLEDVLSFTDYRLENDSNARIRFKRTVKTADSKVDLAALEDSDISEEQLAARYPACSSQVIKTLSEMDHEVINYDLIVKLLTWIVAGQHQFPSKGAILVFLPGFSEIDHLYEMLDKDHNFQNQGICEIYPLHSTLSPEEQRSVFRKPGEGATKIVITTNIAETSLTIDDIVFVVDSGWMKEKRYDQKKHMESLEMVRVSKVNVIQRKGRAGRVQDGVSFHLFTSHFYRFHLSDQPLPEIKRISLEQLVLKVKMLPRFKDKNVETVLENLLEPPSQEAIDGAFKRLSDLGALGENQELTPLGYYVSLLPVDVRIGKLMLFGAIFRCLDPALTLAATLSERSPFIIPFNAQKREQAREKKLEFAQGCKSDFLAMLRAYKGWIEARQHGGVEARYFCEDNFLSCRTLRTIARMKQQFVELMSNIGFVQMGIRTKDVLKTAPQGSDGVLEITGPEANQNSNNWQLISGILVAALYPNVAQRAREVHSSFDLRNGELTFLTNCGTVKVHPVSINFSVTSFSSPFLVFHEKVRTKQIFIRECSEVPKLSLFLFGGGTVLEDSSSHSGMLSMDHGWIRFRVPSTKLAQMLLSLRRELNQLLSEKMMQPDRNLLTSCHAQTIINCIVQLVSKLDH